MDIPPSSTLEMTSMQFFDHADRCNLLRNRLAASIDCLMHYIFLGHCKDPSQWETLFKALSQAVFLKELLEGYRVNVLSISAFFLEQFDEWQEELQCHTLN